MNVQISLAAKWLGNLGSSQSNWPLSDKRIINYINKSNTSSSWLLGSSVEAAFRSACIYFQADICCFFKPIQITFNFCLCFLSLVPSVLLQHVSGKSKNDCFYVIKSITSLILYSPYNTYLLFTSQALVCCLREKNNNFFSYFYFLSLIFLLSSVITTIYYLHDYSQTTQILNIFTYKMVMIISTRCRWED